MRILLKTTNAIIESPRPTACALLEQASNRSPKRLHRLRAALAHWELVRRGYRQPDLTGDAARAAQKQNEGKKHLDNYRRLAAA